MLTRFVLSSSLCDGLVCTVSVLSNRCKTVFPFPCKFQIPFYLYVIEDTLKYILLSETNCQLVICPTYQSLETPCLITNNFIDV